MGKGKKKKKVSLKVKTNLNAGLQQEIQQTKQPMMISNIMKSQHQT